MTREGFWALVQRSLDDAASLPAPRRGLLRRPVPLRPGEAHVLALRRAVGALPDDQLVAFQEQLDVLRAGLLLPDVRDLVVGGLDEDELTDLRTWLVSQGRAAYERVAADPDRLADLAPPDLAARLADAETWGYVALDVWDARRPDDMPRPGVRSD